MRAQLASIEMRLQEVHVPRRDAICFIANAARTSVHIPTPVRTCGRVVLEVVWFIVATAMPPLAPFPGHKESPAEVVTATVRTLLPEFNVKSFSLAA